METNCNKGTDPQGNDVYGYFLKRLVQKNEIADRSCLNNKMNILLFWPTYFFIQQTFAVLLPWRWTIRT